MSRVEGIQVYSPPGPVADAFHLSDARYRILMGPVGSGKTTSCVFELLRRAQEQSPDSNGYRRTRWLIARATFPKLENTTLKSWESLLGERFGVPRRGTVIQHDISFSLSDGTIVSAEFIFMALDSILVESSLRGLEITGAYLNEMYEIPRDLIAVLDTRLGRWPPMRGGLGPTWVGVIGDTNMPDTEHWLYEMAEVTKPDGWRFFKQPGGVIKVNGAWVDNPAAENRANLPADYYKGMVAGSTEDYIRVFAAAEYGVVRSGLPVYPEFSDSHHVQSFEPDWDRPVFIGFDWGLTPAAAFCQQDIHGRILAFAEFVSENIGAAKFAQQLKRYILVNFPEAQVDKCWGDPAGRVRGQTDEKTVFAIMAEHGFPTRPAPCENNNSVLRREALRAPMTRMVDGRPGLLVHPRCRTLRAGLSGKFHYRKMRLTVEKYAETPEKNEFSHVCEALEYVCLGLGEGRLVLSERAREARQHRPKVISGTRRDNGGQGNRFAGGKPWRRHGG